MQQAEFFQSELNQRFEELLASKQVIGELFTITPVLAAKMLERNRNNRPIRQTAVGNYVQEILDGNWITTSQGVCFDRDGVLRDGQHRLTAIIQAKRSVTSFVTFGVDPEAVSFIDTGTRRNVGTILEEEFQCGAGSSRAAICTMIMQKLNRAPETLKSTAEIITVYRTLEGSIDWVMQRFRRLRRLGATAPQLSALVLFHEVAPEPADEFLERVVERMSTGRTDPVEKFREACQIKTPRSGAGVRQEQFQRACNCVAAYHQNREIAVLTASEVGLVHIWEELARLEAPLFTHLVSTGKGNKKYWA